jgi:acyl-CoA reductase-like NAD-dependent aldehyde dehydrogenase
MDHGLFINGQWVRGGVSVEVRNKYSQDLIDTVSSSRHKDVDAAIRAAGQAAPVLAEMPSHKRGAILARAATLISEQREDLAKTIAMEAGKGLKYARAEVDRAYNTFVIASEEAKRIHGETVPMDAVPSAEGYIGFWLRRPVGIVAAITPFNFPLNLVSHKVAPAIAAGNSIVLKPATNTPLTAVKLCKILQDAGLPPGGINLAIGPGHTVGEWLVADPRVAKISFTGSRNVGHRLTQIAGIKKVTLELGNNSPVIVMSDVDLDMAAKRCATGAFYNSGQVCISVQRIYIHRNVYEAFVEKLTKATEAIIVGNPLDERVDVGPLIDLQEANRIESWVDEARAAGAEILTGGIRDGAIYFPTIISGTKPTMKIIAKEVFGPVVSVIACDDIEEALRLADSSEYGLQAGIFTRDINLAIQAVKHLHFGGVIINDTSVFRADHMPYGGNRQSGLGREGVRFAIHDMTNIQMVAIRL